MTPTIEALRVVARCMESLGTNFVFLGGAVIELLVDNPSVSELRPTKDVDVVAEVLSTAAFYALESKLRDAGFTHDTSEGAPLCRWLVDGHRVDIMPVEASPLGVNTRWFREALEFATVKSLGDGLQARVVSAPVFIATKLEAYRDRGRGDFQASHDIEDIVSVVDGCADIVGQLSHAPGSVRDFVVDEFVSWMGRPDWSDLMAGHLSGISLSAGRERILCERVRAISELGS
jgi:predicted nucleotidyltransferase